MVKYRIKQIGDVYYPQKKVFLFWNNIKVRACSVNIYNDVTDISKNKVVLNYSSYDLAVNAIKTYKDGCLRSFWCLGHHIRSYCDYKRSGKYYYIDVTTCKYYSDCLETLCEKIAEVEEILKNSKKVRIHEYVED